MEKIVQQVENENELQPDVGGVPICSANFVSPVTYTANFIGEVHYKIGARFYVEHAD
jgi:hypothetical protein